MMFAAAVFLLFLVERPPRNLLYERRAFISLVVHVLASAARESKLRKRRSVKCEQRHAFRATLLKESTLSYVAAP